MLSEFLQLWTANPAAQALRHSLPLFVAIHGIHLISVVTLAGVLVLRAVLQPATIGVIPPALPWQLAGTAVLTGLLLSMPEAPDYAVNPFMPWKLAGVLLLMLALVLPGRWARWLAALAGLSVLLLGRSLGIFL